MTFLLTSCQVFATEIPDLLPETGEELRHVPQQQAGQGYCSPIARRWRWTCRQELWAGALGWLPGNSIFSSSAAAWLLPFENCSFDARQHSGYNCFQKHFGSDYSSTFRPAPKTQNTRAVERLITHAEFDQYPFIGIYWFS